MLYIIKVIEENGLVSNVEIRPATGKSKPTITRLLAKMFDEGVLISDGAGRAMHYAKIGSAKCWEGITAAHYAFLRLQLLFIKSFSSCLNQSVDKKQLIL